MGKAEAVDGRSSRHEGRRREVMDQAIAYVLDKGLSDLSLRDMADALGISHPTLLHHFGSKEELVERVLAEMRSRQMQQLQQQAERKHLDVLSMLDEAWAQISSPQRLPFWRAFFEIYAVAAKNPERHAHFLGSVVTPWLDAWTALLSSRGLTKARAQALATLVHSSCRGLLIDLLTTGEHARVTSAYKLLRTALRVELEAAGLKR